jgi:hypothetical protein
LVGLKNEWSKGSADMSEMGHERPIYNVPRC